MTSFNLLMEKFKNSCICYYYENQFYNYVALCCLSIPPDCYHEYSLPLVIKQVI